MKHLIYSLLTFTLMLLHGMAGYGQQIKRNANGKKLVRSITIDCLTEDGQISPLSFNDVYTLDYFPNGELRSVERSWKSDEGRRTYRIFIEDDKLKFESTLNGKKDSNVSGAGNINVYKDSKTGEKSYTINSMTQTYKESYYGELRHVRLVTMYENKRVYILSFIGTKTLENEIKTINQNPHSLVECEGIHSPFPFTHSIETCGFNGYRLLAEGDDGIIYTHYMTQEISRTQIGSNYYNRVPNHNYSYENGDIFLSRKNDTNINFQFLLESDNFELMTDWGNIRSRDLIYKQDCSDKYWEYKWDYQFDSSDNIIGVILHRHLFGSQDFKVDLKYVYE